MNKGKLVERRRRKATGLRPQGYDGRVTKSRSMVNKSAWYPSEQIFLWFKTAGRKILTDKGKPGESQGRKAKGLRAELPMIAWLPKKSISFLLGYMLVQVFYFLDRTGK